MGDRAHDYRAVASALSNCRSACIIGHVRPDADAIGSLASLSLALRKNGAETLSVVGQGREISANLYSIPGCDEIQLVESLPAGFDLYVTVDCGSLDRTGAVADQLKEYKAAGRLVCIDHHYSNSGFGSLNLIDSECESTTVILDRVFQLMGIQIDSNIAHALYAGLVTDTGSFRWGSSRMHELAAAWTAHGLDTQQIALELLDATTADDLQMLGRVLAKLQIIEAGKYRMGVLVATREDIAGHSDSAVESLVDFVRALDGTHIGVVFKEQAPGYWATSLRSTQLDCSQIATSLGGGGHIPAAGYSTQGTDTEILNELISAVNDHG